MEKLSAVIITFNEEKNIERCIRSLAVVADEVVVVDSYSTDNTVEICKKLGAKVYFNEFRGHIEQKNYALTKATYKYVLSVDADEVLSDRLRKSVFNIKKDFKYDGYYVNRLNNYCSKWIKHCWYPDRKLRIWDKSKGAWGGSNPHDRFIMQEGYKTTRLKGDLLHYSFNTISEHLLQIDKFSSISARVMFERDKKISILAIIIKSNFRFFRDYILRLGFLDGYTGYYISKLKAYETLTKYSKLRHLKMHDKNNQ